MVYCSLADRHPKIRLWSASHVDLLLFSKHRDCHNKSKMQVLSQSCQTENPKVFKIDFNFWDLSIAARKTKILASQLDQLGASWVITQYNSTKLENAPNAYGWFWARFWTRNIDMRYRERRRRERRKFRSFWAQKSQNRQNFYPKFISFRIFREIRNSLISKIFQNLEIH